MFVVQENQGVPIRDLEMTWLLRIILHAETFI